MPMADPPHPGESLRYDCIEPMGLSVTEAARGLNMSRQALANLLDGRTSITANLALRLAEVFGGGADTWLRLQSAYDLAQARQRQSAAAPVLPAQSS